MNHKVLFSVLCAALSLPTYVQAERKPLVLTTYTGYSVAGLSPNGHWAVGTYQGGDGSFYAFRWNLQTNQIDMLSSNNDQSEGFSISNDGVVAVGYYDTRVTSNGAPAYTGGWWDGAFHPIAMPLNMYADNHDGNTRVQYISADGQWLSGTVSHTDQGVDLPTVWKNGQIAWTAQEAVSGYALCVSHDGKHAAGWSTPASAGGTRVATLWSEGKPCTYLSDPQNGTPWAGGRTFSYNGKYLLYWRGYDYPVPTKDLTGPMALYDMENGTSQSIYTLTADPFHTEMLAVADDGTTVGFEQAESDIQRATISHNGTTEWLEDYLKNKGIDIQSLTGIMLSESGHYSLNSAKGISSDGNVIVAEYMDTEGYLRSAAIKLSEEYALREPVQVQAAQVTDAQAVKVEWMKPMTEAEKVTGYNIYRNGEKVNATPVGTLYYYDQVPDHEAYAYTVTAVYAEGESAPSEAIQVNVAAKGISAPQHLFARQTRLDNALLQWEQPQSNLTVKGYYTDDMDVSGFGASGNSFEAAIRLEGSDLAFYPGKQLTAIAFYPMTEQESWTLNLYSKATGNGTLQLLHSQPIGQPLTYGKKNVVTLNKPIDLQTLGNADLYVAIAAKAKNTSTDNVMGIVYGMVNPLLGDLARLAGEENFYSIYEQSLSSGNPFGFTWAINAILSSENETADVDAIGTYKVYDGDELLASTTNLQTEVEHLSPGKHSLGVEAVYTDGRVSPRTTVETSITPNTDAYYKAVDKVNVTPEGDKAIRASWQAPVDNDETVVTYAGNQTGQSPVGPETDLYSFWAAADYPASKLRGMEGYNIHSLRFYPLCEAAYNLVLQADGVTVAEVEPEEYAIGSWNEVKLPEDIAIEAGKSYRLIVQIYEPEPDVAPLGLDNQVPYMGQSDLQSVDEGKTFSSVYNSASVYGNWMIGLTVASPTEKALPVDHYEVSIDGQSAADGKVNETVYNCHFDQADTKPHSIRVDVAYNDYGTVRGGVTYFKLGSAAGIHNAVLPTLHLSTEGGMLSVAADNVAKLSAYAADGKLMGTALGNKLDISAYAPGVYVVSIHLADGTIRSQKVNLVR